LIITVDTAVAHLAGALGKPFWLINRYNTCWRWLLDRDDSPWYPTARLFRQDPTRNWDSVIARIHAALLDTVTGAPNASSSYVEGLFAEASALHQSGQLTKAEKIYRQIVAAQPDHFDSLHLLGVIFHQRGHHEQAVEQIQLALRINPQHCFALSNLGVALSALRRWEEALAAFDRAIVLQPDDPVTHSNRGVTLQQLKRLEESLASLDRALGLRPEYAEALYNRGVTLQELKRFDEAVSSYDRALALRPDYAEALSNRGLTLHQLKRYEEALASYDRALALRPDYAEAFYNRGRTLRQLRRYEDALAGFDRALALQPDYVEVLMNRGNTLLELQRLDDALVNYDKVIVLSPHSVEAFSNRGNTLHAMQRFGEALTSYDRALALRPDYAEVLYNRGRTLQQLQRYEEALKDYDRALALQPNYAEALMDRGNTLHELQRFDEALASYDKAIVAKPDYVEAYYNRGVVLGKVGRRSEAVADFERTLALDPDFGEARFALCMAQLPILYRDQAELAERRAAYQHYLEALCNDVDQRKVTIDWARAIGSNQPFFLAYQGHNDRDLQSRYGSLLCRIMAERYPQAALSPPPRADEPVRIGIVSGFFYQHSNWKIPILGWLKQIDRRQFRVFGYHTGIREDAATKQALALCDRFVRGPLSIEDWRQTIVDDAPHVLIYPEVGMNPVSVALAAQRLAAIQCNSWGHPETSGLPTLDYFLSSELMEPLGAQQHYTEKVVLLPNLSIYYEPFAPAPVSLNRTDLRLRSSATIYWCGQSLFKYLPQFDQIFPRIAREVGDCQFVFIEYQNGRYVTELFRTRLDKAFAALGLRAADYCVFWPRLDGNRFITAIGQCDIMLDSIGWSGCNTTLESLHYDLPIVTMTAPLMRGRHTMAILKRMGVEETITESVEDYVATAVGLARDKTRRQAIKSQIAANKHQIYRDPAPIAALQEFLNTAARQRSMAN
jgi:tetratricopeptide (TPR) repeat protein